MIGGIGIDSVEIRRFEPWTHFPKFKLLRLFSDEEIAYALANSHKTAERLAGRFAAREALYKALSPLTRSAIPFLTLCKNCWVLTTKQGPILHVSWQELAPFFSSLPPITSLVSLTHTATTATAIIILEIKPQE